MAEFIFDEMVDESLIDNKEVLQLIKIFKDELLRNPELVNRNYFVYHADPKLSALAVSLLNFPFEESDHWKKEYSQSTGYQKSLFKQSYEDFIKTLAKENESQLMGFLKMGEDKSNEGVESAVNYLKLRKVKRMLLENQLDLEKPHTEEEFGMLHQTHEHLKQMEIELSKKMGAVILK